MSETKLSQTNRLTQGVALHIETIAIWKEWNGSIRADQAISATLFIPVFVKETHQKRWPQLWPSRPRR